MSELDPERFRAVFGRLATGVMVLTARHDGVPHGMTVNAVTSVSMDPFLALVCVEHETVMERFIEASGRFALSILPVECEHLSVHFADPGRPVGEAQYADAAYTTATTGSPVLECAIGWIDCRLWATYEGGDHAIFVGEVVDLGLTRPEAPPLVYYRSGYHTVDAPASTA